MCTTIEVARGKDCHRVLPNQEQYLKRPLCIGSLNLDRGLKM